MSAVDRSQAALHRQDLVRLRQDPREWRRRGLTPPAALDAMVRERVLGDGGLPVDPSYADFFTAD
jgi:hypothetical protein